MGGHPDDLTLDIAAATALFEILLDSDTPLLIVDQNGVVSHMSVGLANVLELRTESWRGISIADIVGLGEVATAVAATVADGAARAVSIEAVGRAPVELAMRRLWNEGDVVGALVMAASLQEEYRLRAELATSDARFRTAFETAPLGTAIAQGDIYRAVNPAYARMLRRPVDEIVGHGFAEFTHPDDAGSDMAALREMLAGTRRSYATEKRYVRPDGSIVWGRVHVTPLPGPESGLMFVQVEDITDAKAAEDAQRALVVELRRVAQTLQSSLLPDALPNIAGIELASRYWTAGTTTDVGGDFYDVFSVGDGRWALLIGDVCGRGIHAAAMTSMARHTIRSAALHLDSPSEVLRWLNDALRAAVGQRPPFVTALYGIVEPADSSVRLRYSSGGHPSPVLVEARHGRTDDVTGSLLGVFDEPVVVDAELTIQPGATLVVYTDGCTDAPGDAALTEAEFADLCAAAVASVEDSADVVVSADAIADAISASLEKLRPFAERDDDLALVVLRVEG